MLEIITFTGVDARTDWGELAELAAQYPRAEFAALANPKAGGTDLEFPPRDVLEKLRKRLPRTALHLCGKYAREPASGTVRRPILELCRGFSRVQVNILGDAEYPSANGVQWEGITEFAERVATDSVILQHRGTWAGIPLEHPRLEYLRDPSGGRGLEDIRDWPAPPGGGVRVGYAGGLGPGNIRRALEFAGRHAHAPTWLDMQSGLRTGGRFDPGRVRQVCEAAWG